MGLHGRLGIWLKACVQTHSDKYDYRRCGAKKTGDQSVCSTPALSHFHPLLTRAVVGSPTGHDCVVCKDPIHGAEIRAPCGHFYDIACVTSLFQAATRDETLFPPRCCMQNIPFSWIQPHLSQALITTFQQKKVEFSTLQRVYCSSPTCSRFLGPVLENVGNAYTCPAPKCGRRTCAKCRGKHTFSWMHVCRPDAGTNRVLKLGRVEGWVRCPGCSQMIERRLGCNHMTCRCRTQFCYVCGARWKTCQCPQRLGVSRPVNKPSRICYFHTRSLALVCFVLVLVFAFLLFSLRMSTRRITPVRSSSRSSFSRLR